MALERAHSRPTAALDQSIAAATAAVESAGGLPAAVQDAQAHAAEDRAAAAAGAAHDGPAAPAQQQQLLFDKASAEKSGGTTAAAALAAATPQQAARGLPLAVRVPWAKKPLLNPLGSEELGQQDPMSSPRQPLAMPSHFRGRSGSGTASGPAPLTAPAAPPASEQAGGSSGRKAASGGLSAASGSLKSGSLPSTASAGSGVLASKGGSPGGTAGAAGDKLSPAAAAAARQRLDLSFAAPLLEAHYKCVVGATALACRSVLCFAKAWQLLRVVCSSSCGKLLATTHRPLTCCAAHPPLAGAGRHPLCTAPMLPLGCYTHWRAAWCCPAWWLKAPLQRPWCRWQVGSLAVGAACGGGKCSPLSARVAARWAFAGRRVSSRCPLLVGPPPSRLRAAPPSLRSFGCHGGGSSALLAPLGLVGRTPHTGACSCAPAARAAAGGSGGACGARSCDRQQQRWSSAGHAGGDRRRGALLAAVQVCVGLFMPRCLFPWVANCLGVGRPLLLLPYRHPPHSFLAALPAGSPCPLPSTCPSTCCACGL